MALSDFTSGVSGSEMKFKVQRYVNDYSHEMYTNARKLSGTAIVGADAEISTTIEDYIGQARWYKPLMANINVPSVNDASDGSYTEVDTAFYKYAKTVRTHGAKEVNVQRVISQEDGLAKIARDFGETKAQDEHNSVLETLNGVAAYEVGRGGGIVAFNTDCDNPTTGFYVDVNALGEFGAAATDASDERRLIDQSKVGAMRGERLFKAMGMAWKDYEAPYYYMITSPETLADLRGANLVDDTTITEGNLVFNTIFQGKFRLLLSRATGSDQSSSVNVNDQSAKTTFICKPSALTQKALAVPMPVEMDRAAARHGGSGTTDIWYRWGYVNHPMGYSWDGSEVQFVQTSGAGGFDQAASWVRSEAGYLNLGILPILHA
jgi:hypothetical protein